MLNRVYVTAGGLLLVLCAAFLFTGQGLTLVNLPGLLLVLGGTFLASVIGHSTAPVVGLLQRIPGLLREPAEARFHDHKPFLLVAGLYRRGDVRGAERAAQSLRDPFLRYGSRLALDPHSGEELARMLQWRLRRQRDEDGAEVRILRTMATFAPAFGMLGTLFGLVSLLDDLGRAGLEQIGVAMGFALMSTLYGMMTSNLLFRPLALKLEDRSRRRLTRMAFLLEALVMLYERQHPVQIGEYLQGELPANPPPQTPATVTSLALGRA
jgi:chemotaxis protein MotA